MCYNEILSGKWGSTEQVELQPPHTVCCLLPKTLTRNTPSLWLCLCGLSVIYMWHLEGVCYIVCMVNWESNRSIPHCIYIVNNLCGLSVIYRCHLEEVCCSMYGELEECQHFVSLLWITCVVYPWFMSVILKRCAIAYMVNWKRVSFNAPCIFIEEIYVCGLAVIFLWQGVCYIQLNSIKSNAFFQTQYYGNYINCSMVGSHNN